MTYLILIIAGPFPDPYVNKHETSLSSISHCTYMAGITWHKNCLTAILKGL